MAYGLQIFGSSGETYFDSNVATAGCFVGAVQATGSQQQISYSGFPGRSGISFMVGYISGAGATWDTALGYPRITIPAQAGSPTYYPTYMIFIV